MHSFLHTYSPPLHAYLPPFLPYPSHTAGLIFVDTTVEVLTELLWTILQQHPTLLPVVVLHIVKMLLFPVSDQ